MQSAQVQHDDMLCKVIEICPPELTSVCLRLITSCHLCGNIYIQAVVGELFRGNKAELPASPPPPSATATVDMIEACIIPPDIGFPLFSITQEEIQQEFDAVLRRIHVLRLLLEPNESVYDDGDEDASSSPLSTCHAG